VTVSDGVNPPVTDTATLTVNNVAPSVTATPLAGRVALGAPVAATFPFFDPGTGDTFLCSIDWGDGVVTPGVIGGGACTGSHAYATGGSKAATATVTDDNGGHGSATLDIVVDTPPSVVAGADAFVDEGSPAQLDALATDDFGPLGLVWTATPGAGVDPGAVCTFGNPSLASTTISCNDDGNWVLTLTANDGLNGPVPPFEFDAIGARVIDSTPHAIAMS